MAGPLMAIKSRLQVVYRITQSLYAVLGSKYPNSEILFIHSISVGTAVVQGRLDVENRSLP